MAAAVELIAIVHVCACWQGEKEREKEIARERSMRL
jgi:hypothetical protein